MSVRLGMILSKDCDLKLLEDFKKKYKLGLFKICNEYVNKQLSDDEMFLEATETGCDSLTGIGAYDLYTKDVSIIYQTIEDAFLAQSFVEEFQERKQNYKEDVLKWIEIIKVLKYVYKVNKVGLFWHFCSKASDQEEIIFKDRVSCAIKDITTEYMMKIKDDVLVFFN